MSEPVYHHEIEQGTPEWLQIRNGVLTASEAKLIMTGTGKVAKNQASRDHTYEIAAQRITGFTEPRRIFDDMMRGHADEVHARFIYHQTKAKVTECGFITRVIDGMTIGYSPDGLVGDDGLIEIKSRLQKYQLRTILEESEVDQYMTQIQVGLLVTGRKWLDFISYCGGMPLHVERIYPCWEKQSNFIEAAKVFEVEVVSIIDRYKEKAATLTPTERIIEPEIV